MQKLSAIVLVSLMLVSMQCFVNLHLTPVRADAGGSVGASSTKYSGNPVLDVGSLGSWDDHGVWASSVIFNDGLYRMWYSGGTTDENIRIGYATSTDGESWTRFGSNPVLDVGPSSWDSFQVSSPSVVFDGSKYCMWYSGDNGYDVGYATSSDGITWTKYSGNPVFTSGRYASVIFDGSTYKMWYETYDYNIGYATSSDGISWTSYNSNPVLTPGPSGSWDGFYVSAPSVVFDGSRYIMSYVGYKDTIFSREIGIAYSSDGVTWTKDPNNPIVTPGVSGAWDCVMADHPSLLLVDSSVMMWYTGFDGSSYSSPTYYSRIGLAYVAVPGLSPVGYWKFDEGSGSIAYDSSGNGNDGTVYGATWTDGVSNGALQFDGVSNYVGIASSSSLALSGNQVSLELWIKPTVTLDNSLASRINIIDKGDGYGFQMEAGDGRISFYVNIAGFGDEWLPTTTNDWVAGTWYHIAGTYDGTTEKVYVDGVMENSAPVSGSLSGYSDPLSIGSYCYGTMNFFHGAIDEVKIYNYARSAEEIQNDYVSAGALETPLQVAEKAATWTISQAVAENGGYKWADYMQGLYYDASVQYGAAGYGTLYMELYNQTGNPMYLNYAEGAAQWIITQAVPDSGGYKWPHHDDDIPSPGWWLSPVVSGIGDFLLQMYEATGNTTYLDYATGAAQWLMAMAYWGEPGCFIPYNPPDPYGTQAAHGIDPAREAYTVTFLLHMYEETGNSTYLTYVTGTADWLISGPDLIVNPTGYEWRFNRPYYTDYPLDGEGRIALFFYEIYDALGNATYLQYAQGTMNWLLNQAVVNGDMAKWFDPVLDCYQTLPFSGAGVGGVAGFWGVPEPNELLMAAYEITNNATYLDYATKLANWIISPEMAIPEGGGYKFSNVEGGSTYSAYQNARIYNFLSWLYNVTGIPSYSEYAEGALQWIIFNATEANGGYEWSTLSYSPYYASWFESGAAGIGYYLICPGYTLGEATHYQPVQCLITFDQTGLGSDFTGTVVTIDGTSYAESDLPTSFSWQANSVHTYSFASQLDVSSGKQYLWASTSGLSSVQSGTLTITGSGTVTGNYVAQYQITVDQVGVGSDFTGTVVTVDGADYTLANLPQVFWWTADSIHTFSFVSSLTVTGGQYVWDATSGLSNLQSGTLTITASGNVVGQYVLQNAITFDQSGVSSDFGGTVLTVDGTPYSINMLPVSFSWASGSTHTYAFESLLTVSAGKQLTWTSTTGLSSTESGSITVAGYGSVVGDYKTQYYLTVQTNPSGINSPSGQGWYDAGTYASISTAQYVDQVLGSSRLRFDSWTTNDMTEITNSGSASTTVLVDNAKTVTANYVTQYNITFGESGIGSDFTGSAVTIDGTSYSASTIASAMFWWDASSAHTFAYQSPLIVNTSGKQYVLTAASASSPYSVSGLATVKGTYKTQYSVSFAVSPDGAGSTNPSGASVWEDDGPLSISAAAGHGYTFSSWTSSTASNTFLASGSASTTARIGGFGTITANFVLTPGTYAVQFTESGLPSGTRWSVTSRGLTMYSTSSSMSIMVPAGVYDWSVAPVSIRTGVQYTPSPASGSMAVPAQTSQSITFTQQYYLTIATNVGTTSPSSGWFDSGSVISIQATAPSTIAGERYQWVSWTGKGAGSYSGTNNPASNAVVMQSPISETASWNHQYLLTVSTNGIPSSYPTQVSLGGTNVGTASDFSAFTNWFNAGTPTRTIGVSSAINGVSGTRYLFTSWSDGATGNPRSSLYMNAPVTYTANYRTQYFLTMNANYGTTTPSSGWFDAGSKITISATPPKATAGERYVWSQWTGSGTGSYTGTSNPANNVVTMNGPISEIATWNHQYMLTIKTSGVPSSYTTGVSLGGTIVGSASDASPCTVWLAAGSPTGAIRVDPTVSGASGTKYIFTSWSDGITNNPRGSIRMTLPTSLTANYQTEYQVTFTESGLPPTTDWVTGWSVTLNGVNSGTQIETSISFLEPAGTYSYTINPTLPTYAGFGDDPLMQFFPVPKTGTIAVSTGPVVQPIKFYANDSSANNNWAGYEAISSLPSPTSAVSKVEGSWNVPFIGVTWSPSKVSQWIGIGGDGLLSDDTLIQVGTCCVSSGLSASYYAWYQVLPDQKNNILLGNGYPVIIGDRMQAIIFLQPQTTNKWNITLNDLTRNWHWSIFYTKNSPMYTAEWIVELPGGTAGTLANFGTISFSSCYATIGGNRFQIGSQTFVAQDTMTNNADQTMAQPSALSSDGTSFTVTWKRGS